MIGGITSQKIHFKSRCFLKKLSQRINFWSQKKSTSLRLKLLLKYVSFKNEINVYKNVIFIHWNIFLRRFVDVFENSRSLYFLLIYGRHVCFLLRHRTRIVLSVNIMPTKTPLPPKESTLFKRILVSLWVVFVICFNIKWDDDRLIFTFSFLFNVLVWT